MKTSRLSVVLLLLVPILAPAQKKNKKTIVPAVFAQARYAYVQAADGNELDPGVYQEDRRAIATIQDEIRSWGRYELTLRREDAELVFVVRKGRLASAGASAGMNRVPPGGTIGDPTANQGSARFPGQQGQPTTDVGFDAQMGPPDDLFEVHLRNGDGTLGMPLWTRSMQEGLDGPHPALFRQFRETVDKAFPPGQPVPAAQPAPAAPQSPPNPPNKP